MKVSAVLRDTEGGYVHWCPGCDRTHVLPTGLPYTMTWEFDGNLEQPTFRPSFKNTWPSPKGDRVCHYNLVAGQLQFCDDSTHALSGQTVPLPALPPDDE